MKAEKKKTENKKTAANNQWVSTGIDSRKDKRESRDGPGGEKSE